MHLFKLHFHLMKFSINIVRYINISKRIYSRKTSNSWKLSGSNSDFVNGILSLFDVQSRISSQVFFCLISFKRCVWMLNQQFWIIKRLYFLLVFELGSKNWVLGLYFIFCGWNYTWFSLLPERMPWIIWYFVFSTNEIQNFFWFIPPFCKPYCSHNISSNNFNRYKILTKNTRSSTEASTNQNTSTNPKDSANQIKAKPCFFY